MHRDIELLGECHNPTQTLITAVLKRRGPDTESDKPTGGTFPFLSEPDHFFGRSIRVLRARSAISPPTSEQHSHPGSGRCGSRRVDMRLGHCQFVVLDDPNHTTTKILN
jgi:hypothetical protein